MELPHLLLEEYLSQHHNQPIQILDLKVLSDKSVSTLHTCTKDKSPLDGAPLKIFGYGQPLLIHYKMGDHERRVVLSTATANEFGHENRADRAAGLLLSFDTYNELPRHVAALDVGIFSHDSQPAQIEVPAATRILSLGKGDEFFLLMPYVEGVSYAVDLQRLCDGGELDEQDVLRAQQLALYLVQIHAVKHPNFGATDPASSDVQRRKALYRRRIRDTIGSGEGIMGLIDSYPADYALAPPAWLEEVEKACVTWRWRLKERSDRLCQVHGDYHPFNILFTPDNTFVLLDRSRGAWGEPADDVSCLAINYLFFSLQRSGQLAPPFDQLWRTFWETYLEHTGDRELLRIVVPFLVWRALVLASPIWYKTQDSVRLTLYHFIERIMNQHTFDPDLINEYCKA